MCTKALHTWALTSFCGGSAQFYSCAVGRYFSSVCITHPVCHSSHSYWHQRLSESSDSAPVRSPRVPAAFVGKQSQAVTINDFTSGMKQNAKYWCAALFPCCDGFLAHGSSSITATTHFSLQKATSTFLIPYWVRKTCGRVKYLIRKQAKALNQQRCISRQTFTCSCNSAPLFVVAHSIYLLSLWEPPALHQTECQRYSTQLNCR